MFVAHFGNREMAAHQDEMACCLPLLKPRLVNSYRPSSSHLTRASSSLTCRTVPNSPVGIPKSPKPSTRSPGLKSRPGLEGSTSGGFLARSESGGAPRCDNGGWGALRSLGVGLLLLRYISTHFFPRAKGRPSLGQFSH